MRVIPTALEVDPQKARQGLLFLEKELLACYESWSRPAGMTLTRAARSMRQTEESKPFFLQKRIASVNVV